MILQAIIVIILLIVLMVFACKYGIGMCLCYSEHKKFQNSQECKQYDLLSFKEFLKVFERYEQGCETYNAVYSTGDFPYMRSTWNFNLNLIKVEFDSDKYVIFDFPSYIQYYLWLGEYTRKMDELNRKVKGLFEEDGADDQI